MDTDASGGNKENQQHQPCSGTAGERHINESGSYTSLCHEDDAGTGDSAEQAANSGGQQKMDSIIILSEEQRMKKALLELKNLFYGKSNKCSQ